MSGFTPDCALLCKAFLRGLTGTTHAFKSMCSDERESRVNSTHSHMHAHVSPKGETVFLFSKFHFTPFKSAVEMKPDIIKCCSAGREHAALLWILLKSFPFSLKRLPGPWKPELAVCFSLESDSGCSRPQTAIPIRRNTLMLQFGAFCAETK